MNDMNQTLRRIRSDKNGIGAAAIVVVVVVIIIAAAAAVLLVSNNSKEATIVYTVEITPSQDLDVFVYIDGKEVFSEKDLEPGTYYERTRTHHYKMSGDSNVIDVEAVSKDKSGNILQKTSKILEIHPKETYDVTLHFEGGHADIGYSVRIYEMDPVDIQIFLNGNIFMIYSDVSGMWSRTNYFSYPIEGPSKDVTFKVDMLDKAGNVLKTDSKTITLHEGDHDVFRFDFIDRS